jgi:hypothetical protein
MNLTTDSKVNRNIQYGHRRALRVPSEKALQSNIEALLKEGLGVFSRINLREYLKKSWVWTFTIT